MSKQIFTFSVLISLFFGCGVISTVIARAEDEIIISESLDTESGSSDPDETTGQEEFFATSTDDHIPEDIAVASTTISNSDDNASTTLQSAKETFLDATTTEEDRMADDLNVDVDLVEEITDTTAFESETQITEPGIPTWEIISPSINESVNGRVTVKIRANPNALVSPMFCFIFPTTMVPFWESLVIRTKMACTLWIGILLKQTFLHTDRTIFMERF